MNRSPTSGGMFVAHFTDCSLAFCGMFCVYFVGVRHVIAIRQQHFRKPFAAVGADLSRPHIRIHPQNDKRKCVCGDVEMCI